MEKAKIIFANGEEIEAEVNGSCFILDKEPEFPTDLSVVTVRDQDGSREIENAEIIESASVDNRYWFSIIAIPAEELAKEKTDAQVIYTALMTDTLLEED